MKPQLQIGSRSRTLAALLFIVAAIFTIRLFYLQVIQHNHYRELAMQEQLKRERIPANRGKIYIMNGSAPALLVTNETVYTVFADPAIIPDKQKVIDTMRSIAGGNTVKNFESLLDLTKTRYQVIATKVTRTQADKIKDKGLSGIGFQALSQRVYAENGLAGQVLGFVNNEGQGNYGVEAYMNEALAGEDGRLEAVTDVSDVPLTIGNRNVRVPAKDGKNIVLSLDRNVQSYVEQALADGVKRSGGTNASAIVMDPNTGKVLAMANVPTYDPAKYSQVSVEDAQNGIYNNDAISSLYEPGSTTKIFTMATAINEGVARASDTYVNTDRIKVDDIVVENLSKGQTGRITFQHALNYSLNTGFVTLGQRLGDGTSITRGARDTLYQYFHDRFRLGQATNIELANEASGGVISPDTVQGNAVRYATMTFGQGMVSTPIQMVAGFAAAINGGNYYKPTVIGGYMENGAYKPNAAPKPIATNVISQSTSDQIRTMAQESRRTNYGSLDKPGYEIGGKTGTSQVAGPSGGYTDSETVASFMGYGGAKNDPKYVIMVKIYGKGKVLGGASDAVPIFANISNWMLDYLKVQPKG